jgi:hypothetical protein
MPPPSPFASGFRAVRREPSVLLAEIGWRWLFGGIATALLVWAVLVFLKSVEVSRANQLLLRTLSPELMTYALSDMFRDKWGVLARLGASVGVSLSFLWIVTASIARTATTRVLLEHSAQEYGEEREARSNMRSVAAIQFVRVGLLWCGLVVYVFAALVADKATRNGNESHVGAFLLLFLVIIVVAAVVLSFFNWILLLAPIFAVRDRLGFSDAMLAAWRLSRDRASSLTGLNLAHAGVRLIWLVVMTSLAFAPLGFLHILPKVLVFAASVLVSLAYFAVADVLFVARYAGYIEIAEQEAHSAPEPAAPEPDPAPVLPRAVETENALPDSPEQLTPDAGTEQPG